MSCFTNEHYHKKTFIPLPVCCKIFLAKRHLHVSCTNRIEALVLFCCLSLRQKREKCWLLSWAKRKEQKSSFVSWKHFESFEWSKPPNVFVEQKKTFASWNPFFVVKEEIKRSKKLHISSQTNFFCFCFTIQVSAELYSTLAIVSKKPNNLF